jgi:hypothetical protein
VNGTPINSESWSVAEFAESKFLLGTFEPQPDITAYELAIILPAIFAGMTREFYNQLGPMQRHIRLAS